MNAQELQQVLKNTLQDHRISRGEKKVLKQIVTELNLSPEELFSLRSAAFDLAREATVDPETEGVLDWLEDVIKVLSPELAKPTQETTEPVAYFSPDDNCPQVISSQIQRANHSLDICVFTITDNRISSSIKDAHQRKVKVRIITDNDKSEDLGSDIEDLEQMGIPLRVDQSQYHMHHKFAIFDRKQLLTGSYNWTRGAADHNEENFILTYNDELVSSFQKQFDQLWERWK